jgi:hypothetical protein
MILVVLLWVFLAGAACGQNFGARGGAIVFGVLLLVALVWVAAELGAAALLVAPYELVIVIAVGVYEASANSALMYAVWIEFIFGLHSQFFGRRVLP